MTLDKRNKKNTLIKSLLAFVLAVSIPFAAMAQNNSLDQPFGKVDSMSALTQAIFQLGIAACVLAAAIYIAIGSFYYFYAAGSNAKTAEKGKEVIQRALIGLVLALVSWIILNTIHPQFTELKITPISKSGGK